LKILSPLLFFTPDANKLIGQMGNKDGGGVEK
jgi:hypothetical protein